MLPMLRCSRSNNSQRRRFLSINIFLYICLFVPGMTMERKQKSRNYPELPFTLWNRWARVRKTIPSVISQFLNSNSIADTSESRMEAMTLPMVGIQWTGIDRPNRGSWATLVEAVQSWLQNDLYGQQHGMETVRKVPPSSGTHQCAPVTVTRISTACGHC